MNFLQRLFFTGRGEVESRSKSKGNKSKIGGFGLAYGGGSSFTSEMSLKLSAVYCAVDQISNGVAMLPLAPYHVDSKGFAVKASELPVCHIIECEPNCRMTRFTFIKLLVTSALLRGAGYAYIERGADGTPIGLHFIPFEYVTILPPQRLNEPPTYQIVGINGIVEHYDLISILNYSCDGVTGQSTLSYARETLGLAHDENAYARGFFKNGASVGGVLTVDTPLNDEQRDSIKESWRQSHNGSDPNGIAVLEGGMKFEKITVNPNDSELLASRQFSIPEIARFFCISPTKLFDYSHSSYNTLEATNLSFLTDTIAPWLAKFEMEFERKLFPREQHSGIAIKFDTSKLLRADKTAQANYWTKLYSVGAVSANDIRREIDLPAIENGSHYFIPCNVMEIGKAISNGPTSDAVQNPVKKEDNQPMEEDAQQSL